MAWEFYFIEFMYLVWSEKSDMSKPNGKEVIPTFSVSIKSSNIVDAVIYFNCMTVHFWGFYISLTFSILTLGKLKAEEIEKLNIILKLYNSHFCK